MWDTLTGLAVGVYGLYGAAHYFAEGCSRSGLIVTIFVLLSVAYNLPNTRHLIGTAAVTMYMITITLFVVRLYYLATSIGLDLTSALVAWIVAGFTPSLLQWWSNGKYIIAALIAFRTIFYSGLYYFSNTVAMRVSC